MESECHVVDIAADSISALASRQRGVVTRKQLLAAGVGRTAIKRRLRARSLNRVHRGVYLVGHSVAPEGAAEMAAILACGPGSVISHRSAARLWKLPALVEWAGPVDVTIAGRNLRSRPGLRTYRVSSLDHRDVRHLGSIPATAPARTMLDLASVLPFYDFERAVADARTRGLVRDRDLLELLERSGGRRGMRALRKLIQRDRGAGPTRSEAERKLMALVHAAGLPPPKANALVRGFEVDFVWREQRVVVEVDGFAFHSGRQAFERDRARDATLVASGYTVARVTWRQLVAQPEAVVARIAAALAVRSAAP